MCLKYSKIDNFLQLNSQIFVFEAKNDPFTTSLKKNTANLRTNPKKGGGSNCIQWLFMNIFVRFHVRFDMHFNTVCFCYFIYFI